MFTKTNLMGEEAFHGFKLLFNDCALELSNDMLLKVMIYQWAALNPKDLGLCNTSPAGGTWKPLKEWFILSLLSLLRISWQILEFKKTCSPIIFFFQYLNNFSVKIRCESWAIAGIVKVVWSCCLENRW